MIEPVFLTALSKDTVVTVNATVLSILALALGYLFQRTASAIRATRTLFRDYADGRRVYLGREIEPSDLGQLLTELEAADYVADSPEARQMILDRVNDLLDPREDPVIEERVAFFQAALDMRRIVAKHPKHFKVKASTGSWRKDDAYLEGQLRSAQKRLHGLHASDVEKGISLVRTLVAIEVQSVGPPVLSAARDGTIACSDKGSLEFRSLKQAQAWFAGIPGLVADITLALESHKERLIELAAAAKGEDYGDRFAVSSGPFDKVNPLVGGNLAADRRNIWSSMVKMAPRALSKSVEFNGPYVARLNAIESDAKAAPGATYLVLAMFGVLASFVTGVAMPILRSSTPWAVYGLVPSILYASGALLFFVLASRAWLVSWRLTGFR
jgi:hypothetical protein